MNMTHFLRCLVLFISVIHHSTSNTTSSKNSLECTHRFEFRAAMKEMFGQNCTKVLEDQPVCRKNIVVAFHDHPPYIYLDKESGNVEGILAGLLKIALDGCCYGCTEARFVGPLDLRGKFFHPNVTLVMPVETATSSKRFSGIDFVHFTEVSGVKFLAPRYEHGARKLTWQLFRSVINTWPLFVTAFLMAAIAGCVVWVLDTWFNRDEFPSSFPRGPFEGFWWAFVSMTTVGYGDRAPKSISARLFAVLWILLGITIFSMYTASLTSALTTSLDAAHAQSIYNKKIAVLNTTAVSQSAALLEHAHIEEFETITEVEKAVLDGRVFGMALDDNIANYYMSELNDEINDLTLHHRVTISGNSYGAVSYDADLTIYLRSYFEANEDQRVIMKMHAMKEDWENIKAPKNSKSTFQFFSSSSPMFGITVGVLVAIGVGTIIVGLFIKWVVKKHRDWLDFLMCPKCPSSGKGSQTYEMKPIVPAQLEEQFLKELDDFKARWSNRIATLSNQSTNGINDDTSSYHKATL